MAMYLGMDMEGAGRGRKGSGKGRNLLQVVSCTLSVRVKSMCFFSLSFGARRGVALCQTFIVAAYFFFFHAAKVLLRVFFGCSCDEISVLC